MNSQAYYKTLRKEYVTTNCVKKIAKNTKKNLVKNYQLVNLKKATNPKFRTGVQFGDGTANDEGGRNDKSTNKDEKLIS